MVEAADQAIREHSHVQRVVFFLSAMRHYAEDMRARGYRVDYTPLGTVPTLEQGLREAVERVAPEELHAGEAGEYDIERMLEACASNAGLSLTWRPNRSVLCSRDEFRAHASGRKTLRMEHFYREMRRRYDVLMDGSDPAGGEWNFDAENRGSFPRTGPPNALEPPPDRRDEITEQVIRDVANLLPDLPGRIDRFIWPVTPDDAMADLETFITTRLSSFGTYQDAMWLGEQLLYHARLSPALNTGLLDPREAINRAEKAYRTGRVDIAAAEGFIRQILGWREYVRGVYWLYMPEYRDMNELSAASPLPEFFWTGETDMKCVADTVGGLNEYAYEHHIQRLMVTGLYAMLVGADPRAVEDWYMGMFVDSVEWVTLPNVVGMSQYADGGIMASKPYAATGKYIQRMSNYCTTCRFNPAAATGDNACPFTTLYWDFLDRHESRLKRNRRMALQVKNLERKTPEEREAIRREARRYKDGLT